jgi:5'(3')-deoxyribonucleotidase
MKKILYIDMDGVLVDFESSFAHVSEAVLEEYKDREDEIPGIFGHMAPKPGAIEAYRELAKLYDTYILSTAPWENPSAWSDKLVWVKTHLRGGRAGVAYKRLILTHHKDLCRGHYLVDDRLKRGAAEFEGKLILFGSREYPDWPAVVRYLKAVAREEARWAAGEAKRARAEEKVERARAKEEARRARADHQAGPAQADQEVERQANGEEAT